MQPTIILKEFVKALLLMCVLWKKIEICKRENNCEAIEIATGCLAAAVKATHKALEIAKISYISDACDVD